MIHRRAGLARSGQALDAQGAKGATQEAAGGGQGLGREHGSFIVGGGRGRHLGQGLAGLRQRPTWGEG